MFERFTDSARNVMAAQILTNLGVKIEHVRESMEK